MGSEGEIFQFDGGLFINGRLGLFLEESVGRLQWGEVDHSRARLNEEELFFEEINGTLADAS